jgi:hypothetical protein
VATSPINESGSSSLSLTNPFDPSSVDAASLRYSFACDGLDGSLAASYALAGTTNSATCSFDDNGSYTVKGRVYDKDGDYNTYTATVVVNNVAPMVDTPIVVPEPSNEGGSVTASATFSDPGPNDSPFTCTVNYGDGSGDLPGTVSGNTCTGPAHTYDDNGNYSVTVKVTDKDNDTGSNFTTHQVNNVAPTAALGNNGPVNEGSMATVSFSGQFDPSSTDTAAGFHYAHSCTTGDLSGATYAGSGTSASASCTFDDNGTYTVKARIIDKDDGYTEYTTGVAVNNVAPTATLGNNGPVNEGSPATISFSVQFDPSNADTTAGFHYAYDCYDGSLAGATYASSGTSASTTCTFIDNGSYTVRARIIDKDDGYTEYTTVVMVSNVAPVITGVTLSAASISENDSVTLYGSFTDPGLLDSHTVKINWGDGLPDTLIELGAGALSFTFTAEHQYLDDNPTITAWDLNVISVTVIDKDLDRDDDNASGIVVNNVAPASPSVAGPSSPLALGSSASVTANFTDVGSQDTHTCTFSWDDLTSDTAVSAPGMGNGSCTASHTYTAAGVYAVGVTVTDDDTGSAAATYEFVVVYDPSAGFVTGGGWIMSPAGAYAADPSLTGKATFGFVSKYKKGATAPTGETEFQFRAVSFNFHSEAYQWLVISGAKAQYKGTGTINGVSGYGFLLTAYDGQLTGGGGVDKFRIKIWQLSNSAVVYDNVMGASDDIDSASPLTVSGGSIVIHK